MAVTLKDPYCTEEEVRTVLRNQESATADDVKRAINQASRWLDGELRRDYILHDFSSTPMEIDEFDDADWRHHLVPKHTPIISVDKITIDGDEEDAEDYVVKDNVIYHLHHNWAPIRDGNLIKIYGKFGYDQPNGAGSSDVPTGIPGWLNWSAIQIAAVFSGHHRKETTGLDGQKQSILATEIPSEVRKIINQHRPVVI